MENVQVTQKTSVNRREIFYYYKIASTHTETFKISLHLHHPSRRSQVSVAGEILPLEYCRPRPACRSARNYTAPLQFLLVHVLRSGRKNRFRLKPPPPSVVGSSFEVFDFLYSLVSCINFDWEKLRYSFEFQSEVMLKDHHQGPPPTLRRHQEGLNSKPVKLMDHPPYSSDLTPCARGEALKSFL
ncbi:hypothetical protein EVAR_55084_1 [Eumeta japonica]|uniref:Uncharacterized protein n=1 Tax=Eumeta variegata TaxID=151549 RepID=A0A4C1YIJ3_EUMVA|nr:hypothetical protein EVAR_55084_1 [Eumeta japonica]